MRVLVTRPEPDGARTAARLRARGCDAILAPLLRIEAIEADFGPGPFAAIAVTSGNAVRALARHPRLKEILALPVFAVGDRTAEAARAIGFGEVVAARGTKDDLVRAIARRINGPAPVLYLAGQDRTGDLVGDLGAAGVPARLAVVYRAAAVPELPAEIRQALADRSVAAVLHFSQRSAAIYVDCTKAAGLLDKALAPPHYCLSQIVAQPLIAAGAQDVRIAAQPTEEALIDLVMS